MAKKHRLTCTVTNEVKEGLRDYGFELQQTQGGLTTAYRALLQRAFVSPDAPIIHFEGEETDDCTLDAKLEEIASLRAYQAHHRITARRKGFKRALLQGYSIYLAEKAAQAALVNEPAEKPTDADGSDRIDAAPEKTAEAPITPKPADAASAPSEPRDDGKAP